MRVKSYSLTAVAAALLCLILFSGLLLPGLSPARAATEGSTADAAVSALADEKVNTNLPTYIKNIYVATGSNATSKLLTMIREQDPGAYQSGAYVSLHGVNINRNTGGVTVYTACTYTNNASCAIKAIAVMDAEGNVVKSSADASYTTVPVNFNEGNDGRVLYLGYSRSNSRGLPPLTAFGAMNGSMFDAAYYEDKRIINRYRSKSERVGQVLGQDLNDDAGGDYSYLIYDSAYKAYTAYYDSEVTLSSTDKNQMFYNCTVRNKDGVLGRSVLFHNCRVDINEGYIGKSAFSSYYPAWAVNFYSYNSTIRFSGTSWLAAVEMETYGGSVTVQSGSLNILQNFILDKTTAFQGYAPVNIYADAFFSAPKGFTQSCPINNFGLLEINGPLENRATLNNFNTGTVKVNGEVRQYSDINLFKGSMLLMEGEYSQEGGKLSIMGMMLVGHGSYQRFGGSLRNEGSFLGSGITEYRAVKMGEGGFIAGDSTDGSTVSVLTEFSVGLGTVRSSIGNGGTTADAVDISFTQARKTLSSGEVVVDPSGASTVTGVYTRDGKGPYGMNSPVRFTEPGLYVLTFSSTDSSGVSHTRTLSFAITK